MADNSHGNTTAALDTLRNHILNAQAAARPGYVDPSLARLHHHIASTHADINTAHEGIVNSLKAPVFDDKAFAKQIDQQVANRHKLKYLADIHNHLVTGVHPDLGPGNLAS